MFKKNHICAKWYLENNPDVAASGMTAEEHYNLFGKSEGRLPCPPTFPARITRQVKIFLKASNYLAKKNQSYLRTVIQLLSHLSKFGLRGLKLFIIASFKELELDQLKLTNYSEFIRLNELRREDFSTAKESLTQLTTLPLISLVMPTYNSNIDWLDQSIQSVIDQPYLNWELCIADDASTNKKLLEHLKQWAEKEPRIKLTLRSQNGHISEASNSALEAATGDWICLLDHDDLLHPFALYWVVRAINQYPHAALLYSDEDKIDEVNYRHSPYFKPDWNYPLFLSQNCFSHLGVIKRELIVAIGGFRKGFEGSQDHDLILRAIEQVHPSQIIHIPKVLYHWRAHAQSTAQSATTKPYAALAGERAIREHLQRQGIAADVNFEGYGYRVHYPLPSPAPLVSLIIPTRNGLALLSQCINSIQTKTIYSNYEIIVVDNGSDDPETLRYLGELSKQSNIRVLRDDSPFNYSQLNNRAAQIARGEILGLLNNDLEVIAPDWLNEMVSLALLEHTGAVGAKLLYPDQRIQHAGVLLGVGGVANHAHLLRAHNDHGYFARLSVTQSYSAVTAACLLIKKSIYQAVGGLNEELAVAFNDVDFCLRVRQLGYTNLWTPYALLFHHESATRGKEDSPEKQARFAGEVMYMKETWGDLLLSDPAYNPNLNLLFPDFSLSQQQRLDKWQLDLTSGPARMVD